MDGKNGTKTGRLPPPEVSDREPGEMARDPPKKKGRFEGRKWMAFRSFMGRIPLASLVAWFMCVLGIIIFSGCLYQAVKFLVKQFNIGIVSQILWLVLLLHIGAACFFLFVAVLSTGDTRKQFCTKCMQFNWIGRCIQILVIAGAYTLHFIWLILPAVLILPLAILTALTLACHFLPDCINLSDYGIPPDVIDKIKPDDIINTIKNINDDDLEKYISQAETLLNKAIDVAENSPALDNLLNTIENKMPPPEKIGEFVDKIVGDIDINQVMRMIDQIEHGVDNVAGKVDTAIGQAADKVDDFTSDLSDKINGTSNSNTPSTSTTTVDNSTQPVSENTGSSEGNSTLIRRKRGTPQQIVDNEVFPIVKSRRDGVAYKAAKTPVISPILSSALFPIQLYTFSYNVGYNKRLYHCECNEMHDRYRRNTNGTLATAKDEVDAVLRNDTRNIERVEKLGEEVDANAERLGNEADQIAIDAEQLAQQGAEEIINKAQETGANVLAEAKSSAEDLKAKAEAAGKELTDELQANVDKIRQDLLTAAQGLTGDARREIEKAIARLDTAGEELIQNAKGAAVKLKDTAETLGKDIVEDVQEFADDMKDKAQETAQKVTQKVTESVENIKEQIEATAEELKRTAEEIKEKADVVVKKIQGKIEDTVEDVKEKAEEAIEKGKEIAEDVKEKAKEIAGKAEEKVEEVIEDAKKMVNKAQLVAQVAAKEAELALQKAEDAAKAVMLEVDRKAKELAIEAEKKAREAAKVAQKAAKIALDKARYAAENFDDMLKAAAKGATKLVMELSGKVRQFAKAAIKGARIAAGKAAQGARAAAKVFQSAKKEIVRGYEIFMMVSGKLGIERKEKDTFCSKAKVKYCREIENAQFNFIFVLISAIIINLSMVHFLMAMAANYVYVRREWKAEKKRQDMQAKYPDESNKLMYKVTDEGSVVALTEI